MFVQAVVHVADKESLEFRVPPIKGATMVLKE